MSTRHHVAIRRLLALAMMITSLAMIAPAGIASAQNDRGLIDANSYQSPQFGYSVTWSDTWAVQDRDVITNPGGFDTITLRSNAGTLRISGRADTYNPLTFLQDTIAIQLASGGTIINQDTIGSVPTAELQLGPDRMRLDVISLPASGAVVLVSMRAPEGQYPTALDDARNGVQVDDAGVFGGNASTGQTPTEVATQEGTATTTETPLPTSTVEVLGSGIEGDTFTSPNFGFAVSWDPNTWTVPDDAEYSEPGLDMLRLEASTGPVLVTGWEAYDGNPSSCLLGEQTYYNDAEAGISEYQVAVDANGNELTGSDERSAWGVFTNVYTDPENPNAEPVNYVDYINCVSMGDGESVVIFYSYAQREDYNDHIGKVIALVDSLELPAATGALPTGTPVTTATLPATETPVTTATAPATETPVTTATAPASETPATTATETSAAGQSATVGDTQVSWSGEWESTGSTSGGQQVAFSRGDPGTGAMGLASYGEFQDTSVSSHDQALDVFSSAFFESANAENVTPRNGGTLPDGTIWKSWSFSLQGTELIFVASASQNASGAWVISTLTANEDSFADTFTSAQQEILLNGQPGFMTGLDPATVTSAGAGATTATPPATETVATATPATSGTPPDIGAGDTVTGQTYAYAFTIPVGWSVTASAQGGEVERTELTNGTSTVSIEARAMQAPTLTDCITTVASEQQAQPIYADLELARTSDGDPFTGEDQFTAFANYTFTGPDGGEWAHFMECRWIEQGQSVLVVVQDVPQDRFGAERPARRQIQNSIEVGG